MHMTLYISADPACQQNSCTLLNHAGVNKIHSIYYNLPTELKLRQQSFPLPNKKSAT